MGGYKQKARDVLGVRVTMGFRKLYFEEPVGISQMEKRGR